MLSTAFQRPLSTPINTSTTTSHGVVSIASTTVAVEIADSHKERMQGLSGKLSLPLGTGMLFIFEEEGEWGIWMKDMQFSIDIIWADAEGRIVTIAHGVSPATYPNAFYPSSPAQYVLEVPAGFAAQQGIAEGQQIVVQ